MNRVTYADSVYSHPCTWQYHYIEWFNIRNVVVRRKTVVIVRSYHGNIYFFFIIHPMSQRKNCVLEICVVS
jgi:hypothetical protein